MKRTMTIGTWLRLLLYAGFVLVRLWGMHADGAFPVWDGAGYFLKSTWMAANPLQRIWPPGSFEYFYIRPPGPMWLVCPAMVVRPTFAVFAAALLFWQVVFIEIAVRGLFSGPRRDRRTSAAIVLIAGSGVFFTGLQLFYVDALLTAQAAAAIGLAAVWLQRSRPRAALGLGLVLAIAICTKPTGLMVTAAVSGALVLGYVCRRFVRGGWSGVWRCGPSPWKHALAVGVPLALACAGMFLTSYGNVFEEFRLPMSKVTLWRQEYEAPVSLASLKTLTKQICETVGLPLLALLAVAGGISVFGVWRRRAVGRPLLVFAFVVAVLMLGATGTIPFKQHRYVAPAAMACLCLLVGVIGWRPAGRRWLIVCAVVAVGWRGLVAGNVVKYREPGWIRGHMFRAPMHRTRDFLRALDSNIGDNPSSRPSLFACDLLVDVDAVSFIQTLRREKLDRALREMGVDFVCDVHGPTFPDFAITPLPRFVSASHLTARAPDDFQFDPDSQYADWQKLNRLLWSPDTARSLGWIPIYRNDAVVLYGPLDPAGSYVSKRIRFLSEHLVSPEVRAILSGLCTVGALRESWPSGREIVDHRTSSGATGILLHAEYPGNPLPHTVRLGVRGDESLLFEARQAELGDGVVIRLSDVSSGAEITRALGRGATLRLTPGDLPGGSGARDLKVTIERGPANDSANDCVTLVLDSAP